MCTSVSNLPCNHGLARLGSSMLHASVERLDHLGYVHQVFNPLGPEHVELVHDCLDGHDQRLEGVDVEGVVALAEQFEDLKQSRRHGWMLRADRAQARSK